MRLQGLRERTSRDFKGTLTVGKEYVVIALTFWFAPARSEVGPYVDIIPDVGPLVAFPLALFEITDARPSRYWEVSIDANQDEGATEVIMGPPSIFDYLDKYWKQVEDGDSSDEADLLRAEADLLRTIDLVLAEADGRLT